jgi:myo-inositol 2-dehydrogenase / D-chiro-inositol 1-dehydrogenase
MKDTRLMKIGVSGCGHIAAGVHLPILGRMPGVVVTAVADCSPDRRDIARRLAPSARPFDGHESLVRDADVDAVVVALPTALHEEAAISVLKAGRHLFLEKPLGMNLDGARPVVEAGRRAKVTAMVGFNLRFHPLYAAARQQLASGRLGDIVSVRTVFSSAAKTLPLWKRRRTTGGGALLDLASHHIDLLRLLLAREFTCVAAVVRSRATEHDTAALTLECADGLIVQSLVTFGSVEDDRLEIYGQHGMLRLDRYSRTVIERVPETARARPAWRLLDHLSPPHWLSTIAGAFRAPVEDPSYEPMLRAFVAAARTGTPVTPGLEDGFRALAVIDAAERAASAGGTVAVPS